MRNCLLKLFVLHGELQRQARREHQLQTEADLPFLWVIATSASAALLDSFGARQDLDRWPCGVYFLPEAFRTAVVVINQLPITPETLWLRILGKGDTQQRAINELIALPLASPLRRNVLELIASWRANLEIKGNLTEEEEELMMNLSPAYLQWKEKVLQQGIEQGIEQGIQQGVQQGLQQGIQQGVQQGLQQGVQQGIQQGVQQGLQQGVQQGLQQGVQQGLQQGIEQGIEQGIQQGVQEGLQEGRLEERRLFIENLLRFRFGTVDEALSGVVEPMLTLLPEVFVQVVLQLSSLSREELLARFPRSGD